jgi:quercetin dioxygenase-like cupin family protein
MAESQSQESSRLRTPKRFITDYDASGLAVFNTSIPDSLPDDVIGNMVFYLGYATTTTPADFTNQSDIVTYSSLLSNPPGIYISGGSVMRIIDFGPGCETPMHRTASLDYGVVLEGEIELILDSGDCRVIKRGDISVQRGTDHRWRNRSQTEWGRMLFVSQEAKPVEVNGKILEEEHHTYTLENANPSGV